MDEITLVATRCAISNGTRREGDTKRDTKGCCSIGGSLGSSRPKAQPPSREIRTRHGSHGRSERIGTERNERGDGDKGMINHVLAGIRHDVIYLILGLQSVSSRLSTVSVDTSRSDQPPAGVGGRHLDRPEHHHEHHHNHRHRHEHHHSVSPRSNQRHHPVAASTPVNANVVAADVDAASPQSNAQRHPVPRYVRIFLPNFVNQPFRPCPPPPHAIVQRG